MKTKIKFISIFLIIILTLVSAIGCKSNYKMPDNNKSTGSTTVERLSKDLDVINIIYNGIRSLDFGKDWKFILVNPESVKDTGSGDEKVEGPAYNDSEWNTLDIPHDWSIELLPISEKNVGVDYSSGFFQGGLGWYRKTFILPSSMKDKKISIDFDGVYMDSYVYMNGKLLGNHPYGYTGFSFNLTGLVYTDGKTPNVIAVKVQNPVPSSRWYSGSGIYRNVRLVVTEDIYVKRWGITITNTDLKNTILENYANLYVKTDILNERGVENKVKLISKILDADGNIVKESISEAVSSSDGYTFEEDIKVQNPVLWSLDNPYLYTLESSLLVDDSVVDEYKTAFGIRYFEIDPDYGFSLNGEYLKIQGVNLHHDLGALGAAVNYDAILRQLKIMKSMGVNAIRTAHNPPAPELLEAADRLGMFIMVEAFDCWQIGKNLFDYGRFFDDNCEEDIIEMVNAAKNSPSVIMWSIGNEIRNPDVDTARKLINTIKSIDKSRPIVWGSDGYRSVPDSNSVYHDILLMLDGLGLNYNTAESLDELRVKYPDKFIFEAESSSSTSTRGAYQEPYNLNTGENYTPGRMEVSSFGNNMASWTMPAEYCLKKDRDRKFFAGQFLWSGIDYIGEPTPYYDIFPVKSSFFGAVDTAGFPKDLYYLFKSQWTSEPMVHLLPMNWTNYEQGEEVQVWAYSNVNTVELFLNGKSMGVRTFDRKITPDGHTYLETTEETYDDKTVNSGPYTHSYTSPNGSVGKLHLEWSVLFEPGTLTAVATKNGREVARDEIKTAGTPSGIRLIPDTKAISADGESMSFITVEIIDSSGVVVPDADNLINFEVIGGLIAGVDNGRQESAESYKAPYREAFNGKALLIIQSNETYGPIAITATSRGLLPAKTTVYSVKEADPNNLIAFEPLYIRTLKGINPVPYCLI